jgi:hypothetical protein
MTTNPTDTVRFLREAAELTSPTDPNQGLVYLRIEDGIALFGYVRHVTDWLVSLSTVTEKRQRNGGWSATTHDYEVQVSARHIILCRYADLSDTEITERGSWT